jgi:hypothetical protein
MILDVTQRTTSFEVKHNVYLSEGSYRFPRDTLRNKTECALSVSLILQQQTIYLACCYVQMLQLNRLSKISIIM